MYLTFTKYKFLKKGLRETEYNKLQMEVFKKIENYENYEISNIGRVKNAKTGRILKQSLDIHGYKIVTLYKNGKKKTTKIHKLVAFAFLDKKDNKSVIDHKDRDKTNNHFSNLRFCTQQENNCNKSIAKNNASGCSGVSFATGKNRWRAQIQIDGKSKHIGYFKTLKDATEARLEKEKEIYGEFAPKH